MGFDPLSLGLTMGGLSAGASLLSGLHSSSQQRATAATQQAQAQQLRSQAAGSIRAGQQELANLDRQRAELRRNYDNMQAANNVSLGVGNVDASTGSAMDVALGNADRFAGDLADNAYSRALKDWETKEQARSLHAQANVLDSQASWAKRSANNLLPTILGAGLSGLSGFMTGYSYGGKLGGDKPKK